MDTSFVENLLERARERQRKLNESTPLSDANVLLDKVQENQSASPIKVTPQDKTADCKDASSNSRFTSTTYDSSSKSNFPEGRVQKILRHNSTTKISSNMPSSPQPQVKTLNIQKENFNMEIKLISSDNVRVDVEIQESDNSDDDERPSSTTNDSLQTPGLREEAKHKLKKLGKLYAGGEDADISSPIQRTEARFLSEDSASTKVTSSNKCASQGKGLSKLAGLAQNISQWEDNWKQSTHSNKYSKLPAPQPPTSKVNSSAKNTIRMKPRAPLPPATQTTSTQPTVVTSAKKITPTSSPSKIKTNEGLKDFTRQLQWDQSVLASLESQGFTRTTSNSRLVYKYHNNSQEEPKVPDENAFNENNAKTSNLKSKTSIHTMQITNIEEEQEIDQENQPLIRTEKFIPLNIPVEEEKLTPRSPAKLNTRTTGIANRAAAFESSPNRINKDAKDPALLSLAERKALFEKNKGAALIPKSAFGMAVPVAGKSKLKHLLVNDGIKDTRTPIVGNNTSSAKAVPVNNNNRASNKLIESKPLVSNIDSQAKVTIAESGGIASKIAALARGKNTISQVQIQNEVKEQRQKEMDVLLNRFNKHKTVTAELSAEESDGEGATETTTMIAEKPAVILPAQMLTATPMVCDKRRSAEKRTKKSDSPQVAAVLEDVKRIRVNRPKDGKLYPCLSDIETANETEPEHTNSPSPNSSFQESFCSSEGGANTSFGREILQAVCKNQTPQKRLILDESITSDVSDILDDMDDYLDEAMAGDNNNSTNGPTPPKFRKLASPVKVIATPSESFHYKSFSPKVNEQTSPNIKSPIRIITSPRKQSDLPTHVVDGESILPLTHTVSFYRKQQTQVLTPSRQIHRQPDIEESKHDIENDDDAIVSEKIQELLDEVNKQQMIISQTSQALNLCNSTPEFMGSTEQVEADKVLLLATHRRQAALHEVQRLRVEKTLRPQSHHSQNVPLEKGTLTITNMTLPLKREYVRALAAAGGKGHHVVCLIKCAEQVISTQLVSTVADTNKNPDQDLTIPGTIRLDNIYSDFTVTFEVYCLQAQEEVLPHEVKYHINKKGSNKLTPKKSKQDSRMTRPPKESPAGPQAVRSSTFALMGFVVFSIQSMNKIHWTLNKAPPMSPLEGSVGMKVSCELAVSVEYRGFLTMFEDVSGFGSWHRRWCLLKGHVLSYWKYPDDEKKKAPIDTMNLKNSITDQVGPVSRNMCARLHTFLIENEREAYPEDKETLTVLRKGNKTVIRHLLSADTKEERIEWCNMFNKALTGLKMWGNK